MTLKKFMDTLQIKSLQIIKDDFDEMSYKSSYNVFFKENFINKITDKELTECLKITYPGLLYKTSYSITFSCINSFYDIVIYDMLNTKIINEFSSQNINNLWEEFADWKEHYGKN